MIGPTHLTKRPIMLNYLIRDYIRATKTFKYLNIGYGVLKPNSLALITNYPTVTILGSSGTTEKF